jgi:N-acetylmuramoyl-L-alanine amidase
MVPPQTDPLVVPARHRDPARRSAWRRTAPRHARRRPPVRRLVPILTGVVVAPLVLTLWVAGGGNAGPAFAATTTVQPGDTLSAIAQRYHTTVAALSAANGITNPNQIDAGATIVVPTAPSPHVAAAPPASAVAPATMTIVVRTGDTLTSIAARYQTTVAALVSVNKITHPNLVFAGTKLVLPGTALPPGWGPGGPLPSALLAHPERLSLRPAFLSAAHASGVAPSVLEALCWWESGWQPAETSSTGAMGLCQLEPSTVTYARDTLLGNPALNPWSGPDNIAMAAAYIQNLTVRDGGNVRTAVAAYYQGLSSVQKSGLLLSTQNYVTGIFNYAAIFARAG